MARRVWEDQRSFRWPGLSREVREICNKLGLEDANTTRMSKKEYRRHITTMCHLENEKRLRKAMENKDKCAIILEDGYGRKPYVSEGRPGQVREVFATRVHMLPIAGNFSHDRRFARTDWQCRCMEAREDEEHLRSSCDLYSDIREQYGDLSSEEELVSFFRAVLKRRDEYDEQEARSRERAMKET